MLSRIYRVIESRKLKIKNILFSNSLKLEMYPGSKILRQVAADVTDFGKATQNLASQMLDFMRKNNGVGLAAPQIGLSEKIIVAEVDKSDICIINPEIKNTAGSDFMEEGCLSLPGKCVNIKRNSEIEVKGMGVNGKEINMSAKGLMARVLQHEIDHLNGILICDYENKY
jgi:peptide deformylase